MMKVIRKDFAKLYNFFYFMFWGFYFSAGYFYCKNIKNYLYKYDIKI